MKTTKPQAHSALAQFLLSSDWLRYQLSLREQDNQRLKSGERLIYAVDTNILHFYVDYQTHQALDFANLVRSHFLSPNDRNLILKGLKSINNYLGIFIFWKLGQGQQLLVFPGVATETTIAINNWLKSCSEEQVSEIMNKLAQKLRTIEVDKHGDASNLANWIEEAKSIIDSLFAADNFYKFYRFNNLLKDNRLIMALGSSIQLSEGEKYEIKVPSLDDSSRNFQLKDVFDYRKGVYEWFKKIKDIKSQAMLEKKIFNDAESIALLEYINHNLVQYNSRLVLITTDTALMSACAQKGLVDEDETLSGFSNFAEAYLRYPYSFLADSDAWPPDSEENISYNKLKDLLIPGIDNKKLSSHDLIKAYRGYRPLSDHIKLADDMATTSDQAINIMRKFYQDWNKLWQKADSAISVEHTLNMRKELEDLRSRVLSSGDFTGAILELIFAPVRDLIESAGKIFDLPLIGQNAAQEGQRCPRGLPPIKFDQYQVARNKYAQLLGKPEKHAVAPNGDELINEDPTLYIFCLYIAAALCVFNHLERAMIFARQAATIGDWELKHLNCDQCHYISGREAYYLLAYLTRLVVDKPEKLSQVDKLLNIAAKRYKSEKGLTTSGTVSEMTFNDYIALDDLRFASLQISTEISRFLFNRYQPDRDKISNDSLIGQAEEIVKKLNTCLSKLSEQIDSDPEKEKKYEVRILQGDLLCNLIVQQIEIYDIDPKKIDKGTIKWIQALKNNLWPSKYPRIAEKPKSEYIQLILKIAELLFTPMDKTRHRDTLSYCLQSLQQSRMQSFHYDKERFSRYAELIRN